MPACQGSKQQRNSLQKAGLQNSFANLSKAHFAMFLIILVLIIKIARPSTAKCFGDLHKHIPSFISVHVPEIRRDPHHLLLLPQARVPVPQTNVTLTCPTPSPTDRCHSHRSQFPRLMSLPQVPVPQTDITPNGPSPTDRRHSHWSHPRPTD